MKIYLRKLHEVLIIVNQNDIYIEYTQISEKKTLGFTWLAGYY